MLISLLGYKNPRLSEIIRNTYHCAPSQGMTGEELHNFCKFLYSQIQSKDEEISCLIANIKELTYEVRLSRLQQQTYNDENKALSATHSQKLDNVQSPFCNTFSPASPLSCPCVPILQQGCCSDCFTAFTTCGLLALYRMRD